MTYRRLLYFCELVLLLAAVAVATTARGDDESAFSIAAILFDDEALDRPHDVELQANWAFVPGKGGSIAVIDVGDPGNPRIVWHYHDADSLLDAETVMPLGKYLFLGTSDLISMDITDPRKPVFKRTVSNRPQTNRINGMARRGDYIFAAGKDGWVTVFDVSDPAVPRLFGALNTRERGDLGWPHDIDIFGDHILVVDPARFGRSGLPGKVGIYRVADRDTHQLLPAQAWELDGLLENLDLVGANRIQVAGHHAYVAGSQSDRPSNAVVIDISDPARPVQVATLRFSDTRGPNGLTIAGEVLFLAGGQTIEAVDISDPAKPRKLASFRCLKAFKGGRDSAHDLVYRDGYLFVTGQNDNSFSVLKVTSRRIRELAGRPARRIRRGWN